VTTPSTLSRLLATVLCLGIALLTATPAGADQPARQLSSSSAETDFVELDRSASFNPSHALSTAKVVVAASIAAIPRVTGSRAHTIYIATISDDSYDPREVRLVIHIPAVPTRPTPPDPNPLNQDDTLKQLITYQHAVRTYRAALATAHTAADRAARDVRSLGLPSENKSTDVWGALQRASDAHVNHLIIASDLDYNGQQQVALHHSLRRVAVRVIEFQCGQATGHGNQARLCEQRKAYWKQAFEHSGTTDVTFSFPDQPVGDLFGQ
jgi:hypothetical protein